MTIDEAIKYAKENILAYTSKMAEFQVLAIEALEKQISKQPKSVTRKEVFDPNRPFATIDVTTLICPCCKSKIMFRKTIKRCLECGQRLDW